MSAIFNLSTSSCFLPFNFAPRFLSARFSSVKLPRAVRHSLRHYCMQRTAAGVAWYCGATYWMLRETTSQNAPLSQPNRQRSLAFLTKRPYWIRSNRKRGLSSVHCMLLCITAVPVVVFRGRRVEKIVCLIKIKLKTYSLWIVESVAQLILRDYWLVGK